MKEFKDIVLFAKQFYENDNSGHGFDHIKRVLEYSKLIYEKEGGDWEIIFLSVLFHDIHRMMSNEEHRYVSPEESLDKVKGILETINIEGGKIEKILFNIKNHEEKEKTFDVIELNILKDADIIDALGEVGLRRTLKYCKDKNIPVSNFDYPLDSKEYVPDYNPLSTCHYIYRTMLKHVDFITTNTGKKLAKEKIKILQDFLNKYYPKLTF